jgi:DNA-binding FadR family transcriptional regulator
MGEPKQKYLKPIKSKSVVQQVIDRLTLALIHKELRPGDKIPTEQELAATFGAARNSVREAIKILVSFGVLEIRRPEGTFVTDGFSDPMIDPLLYGIILDNTESLDSLMELRSWMDVGMLRLAMNKATSEDITLLDECVNVLKKACETHDQEAIFQADNNFHEVLAQITHNTLFGKIGHMTRLLTTDLRQRTVRHILKERKEQIFFETHMEMVEAIKKKDIKKTVPLIGRSYFYDEGALEE